MTLIASSDVRRGLDDIAESLSRPSLWLWLGIRDVMLEHTRATLGILWPVLSALAWIGVIYLFLGPSLNQGNSDYLAYVTIGVVSYNFALGVLATGVHTFLRFKGIILNIPNPLFIYPLRITVQVFFSVSLQVVLVIAALLWCGITPHLQMLLVFPAFAFYLLTGVFVSLIIGMVGVKIGDLRFIMATVMRLMMFATPIFWYPTDTGVRMYAAILNPLAHYIEVIRAPLLGQSVDPLSIWVVLGSTIAVTGLGLLLFLSRRNAIVRSL